MRISIIIPIYDVEPFIKRCLESIMMQDCVGIDIECVLVDDCGHDNSMGIVKKMLSDYDGKIHFIITEHQRNRGLSAARNSGLDISSGDYVMFVDSDDYLEPQSISYFVDNLKNYPNVDVVVGNVSCYTREYLFHNDIHQPLLIKDSDELMQRMLNQQINVCAWNKLVRRVVLESNNIRFVEGIIFEDMTWSYLLFSKVSSALLLPKITYVYENNPNSITCTALSSEKVNKALWSYMISCNYLLDNPPDSNKYRRDIFVEYLLFVNNIMMRASDYVPKTRFNDNVRTFYSTRSRLMSRAIKKGRILLSIFFLFLYSPFKYMKRLKWFRHHHKIMEQMVARISHMTDYLHC